MKYFLLKSKKINTRGLNNERLNKVSSLNLLSQIRFILKNLMRLHTVYIYRLQSNSPCATFSDTRHAVRTTKISFPTQSTTENWTTKSLQFWLILNKESSYSSILTY